MALCSCTSQHSMVQVQTDGRHCGSPTQHNTHFVFFACTAFTSLHLEEVE